MQTNLRISRANLEDFSQLNKILQPETLDSETRPFTRHLFQLKNKVQYHEKLVSNKSLVCTRRVLRIHIFSALLETKGLEACVSRKLHEEKFQRV